MEWYQQHATWMYQGVLDGEIVDYHDPGVPGGICNVELHELGRVPLPDGTLMAADVFFIADAEPFKQACPPGEHRCFVANAVTGDTATVLAALLVTGRNPVVRWQLGTAAADLADSDPAVGEYVGFPVDGGLAAFFSPAALDDGTLMDVGDFEEFWETLEDRGVADGGVGGAVMRGVSGLDVAVFRSGDGDGHYPTWFGYAADGSVSVALADFLLFRDGFC